MTVPWSLRYQDGINYLEKRREWIRDALKRQKKHSENAVLDGKSVGNIADGTSLNTLVSKIIFIEQPTMSGQLSVKIRTSHSEYPEAMGRLWYSIDRPMMLKQIIFPPEASQPGLRKVLVEVLREEAKVLLDMKISIFAEKYGFQYRRLTIKHNSSNWGSCSRAGNINLNLNLVRLPEPLCDYVLLHELSHLKEPNHGPGFHILLERLCRDNIKGLIAIGSTDAEKYKAWIDDDTISGKTLTPLNEVLSREVSSWRMV